MSAIGSALNSIFAHSAQLASEDHSFTCSVCKKGFSQQFSFHQHMTSSPACRHKPGAASGTAKSTSGLHGSSPSVTTSKISPPAPKLDAAFQCRRCHGGFLNKSGLKQHFVSSPTCFMAKESSAAPLISTAKVAAPNPIHHGSSSVAKVVKHAAVVPKPKAVTRQCRICLDEFPDKSPGILCDQGHFIHQECFDHCISVQCREGLAAPLVFQERHSKICCPVGFHGPGFADATVRKHCSEASKTLIKTIRDAEVAIQKAAADEQLRLCLHSAAMFMCPRCREPVEHTHCSNLASHHGQNGVSNACKSCGFFAPDISAWIRWDGKLAS